MNFLFPVGLDATKAAAVHVGLLIFRNLFFYIDKYIYQFISISYNIFKALCTGEIVSSDQVSLLFGRIGIILGLIMLFRVAFNFIQLLVNPNDFSDGKKGMPGIIKKIILVVVMLGMSTYVFALLTQVQVAVINSEIIPKLLLPYEVDVDKFGNILSGELFNAFVYIDGDITKATYCNDETRFTSAQNAITKDGDFGYMDICLSEYDDDDAQFIIEYNFLFSTIVGVIALWFLFSYCISVGVRMIQLAVLQIISPVAILGYLSPKDENMFSNWMKKYIGTYVDVFIRLIIINFAVYLCALLFGSSEVSESFWSTIGTSDHNTYIKIIMVLAILSFAKKAPDLIKSLFPGGVLDSGIGFGVDASAGAGLGAAVGLGVGAIGGFAGGKGLSRVTGALSQAGLGTLRGGKAGLGAKGAMGAIGGAASTQSKFNLSRAQAIASGKGFGERVGDSVRGKFGMMSGYDKLNQELNMSNSIKSTLSDEDVVKHIREIRQSYIQACASRGVEADGQKLIQYDKAEKEAIRQMYEFSHDNADGQTRITISDPEIGLNISEDYTSNVGIYNKIHTNEKRAGKTMNTYAEWKEDNTEIQQKIADKHKGGS